jgi:hypothetical protein
MTSPVPRAIVQVAAAALCVVAGTALFTRGAVIAGNEGRGAIHSTIHDGIFKIEADGASVPEILEDLSRTLGFEVRGEVPNTEVKITRSLEGTLDEVLGSLLRDASYVLVTDAGAPRRLIILPPGSAAPATNAVAQPFGSMSVEQLHQKEGELVVQIARYEDMSEEAREHANPEFARKFKTYARKLAGQVEAIRARLAPHVPKMQ